MRLAWSAEPSRIFAAFQIADDHYLEAPHPDPTKSIYPNRFGDVVGIEVDGDHGGGRWEGLFEYEWGGCSHYLEKGEGENCIELQNERIAQTWEVYPGPDGFSVWNWNVTTRWQRWDLDPWPMDSSFTAAAGRIEPGVLTTIELMVAPFDTMDFRGPEYSTPSRLRAGQTIGLEIYLKDNDPEEPGTNYLLGNPEFPWYYAESFADALLVPAADRGTGVERITWGRLKRETAAGD